MDEAKIAEELQDMKEELGEASLILWALKNRKEKLKDWCEIGEDGKLEGKMARSFRASYAYGRNKDYTIQTCSRCSSISISYI